MESVPQTTEHTPAAPLPASNATSPTGLGTRSFFIKICIGIILFGCLEIGYQYFVLHEELPYAILYGCAIGGATLISTALSISAFMKWKPRLAKWWRLRRNLGVSGTIFVLIHIYMVIVSMYGGDIIAPFKILNPIKNPNIFGLIAALILVVMASISNEWSIKRLGGRRWKTIHRFIYIGYPAAIFHYTTENFYVLKNPPGYLLLAITAFAVLGQLFWFFKIAGRKKFRTRAAFIGFCIIALVAIVSFFVIQNILNK